MFSYSYIAEVSFHNEFISLQSTFLYFIFVSLLLEKRLFIPLIALQ